jgi:hypothetical protein
MQQLSPLAALQDSFEMANVMQRGRWVYAGLAGVLLFAISLQFIIGTKAPAVGTIDLRPLLALPEWKGHSIPLTQSETEKQMTETLLRYDESVRMDFSNGRLSAEVLIFAWNPKKISPERIMSHTPDVCWVEGGMEMLNSIHGMPVSGELPAEYRKFGVRDGRVLHVMFWPLYDGELSPALRENLLVEGVQGRLAYHARMWWALVAKPARAQHYIRITFTVPPEDFFNLGGLQLVRAAFDATANNDGGIAR